MTQEIDQSTGRAAVFVTDQPVRHGLGTVVAEAQTSEEAILLAALDWDVVPISAGNCGAIRACQGDGANPYIDSSATGKPRTRRLRRQLEAATRAGAPQT